MSVRNLSFPLSSLRAKVIASAVLIAAAAGAAGLGSFGTFTSTTSASSTVSSGKFRILLGTANSVDNRLTIGALDLAPGDSVQRAGTFTNTGEITSTNGVVLTTSAVSGTSSLLDTDAVNGLQMTVQRCSSPWTETTLPNGGYTYTCSATLWTLIASRPVIGSSLPMSTVGQLVGASYWIMITLTLPQTADNSFQGLGSTINFRFDATQRGSTNR